MRSRRTVLLIFGLTLFVAADAQEMTQAQNAEVEAAPVSRIVPPPDFFHFPEKQKFVYSVEWHMLNAGTATIFFESSNANQHLHSTADTSGLVNKIYPVHDTFDADLDPHTFCTLQISKHSEEGAHRLDRKIRFDYQRAKSEIDDLDLKTGQRKHDESGIPACITDVVSGFFYVSSLELAPRSSQTFPVAEKGKTNDIKFVVESRSKIKVPLGEFQAVRLLAEPISGPLKGKGTVWIWYTDDARHIPLQMRSKLGFANLLFQLQKIETVQP